MSLNWELTNAVDNDPRLNYTFKDEKQMHPKLHCLIFLTMVIGQDFQGNEKKKQQAFKRLRFLRKIRQASSVGIALNIGRGAFDADPVTWAGTEFEEGGKYGEYRITEADIETYWGLSTNASEMTDAKWFARMVKFLNDERV